VPQGGLMQKKNEFDLSVGLMAIQAP